MEKKRKRRRLRGKSLLIASAGLATLSYGGGCFTSGNLVAPPPVDAGGSDAGPEEEDAGTDAGLSQDAGTDAGPAEDAAVPDDAGAPEDGGVEDAGG